jgi:excisionase family DNA binding protein
MSASIPPGTIAASLTAEQLRQMLRKEVDAALAARDQGEPWLTTIDAAKRISMHPKTVARLVRHEGLPAHRLGGTEYRFRASEIDAWLLTRDSK